MPADTLKESLLPSPDKRGPLLDACVRTIEAEVKSKSGLSGLAIKGGFKVLNKVKPGMVRESMDDLLDAFIERLEPMYTAWGQNGAFSAYVLGRKPDVADALLGITDDRARGAKNRGVKSTYEKLRPQAKKHVEAALPRVVTMLEQHMA